MDGHRSVLANNRGENMLSEKKSRNAARFKSVERREKRKADPTKEGMSAKVLEMWVKDTLAEAESAEIPGTISTVDYKDRMVRYGIDR